MHLIYNLIIYNTFFDHSLGGLSTDKGMLDIVCFMVVGLGYFLGFGVEIS